MNMKKIIKCNALVVRFIVFQPPDYLSDRYVPLAFCTVLTRQNEGFVQAFPFRMRIVNG